MIRVVGPDGRRLAPTEKYDYIYKKLMNKEAVVVQDKPFTVKILKFGKERLQKEREYGRTNSSGSQIREYSRRAQAG